MQNPDRDRRALLVEFLLVLVVLWLPLFAGSIQERFHPQPRTLVDEFGGLAVGLGSILLVLYLVRRNGESLRHLAIRRTRWGSEVLWAAVIYGAAWIAWICFGRLADELGWTRESPPGEVRGPLHDALLPAFLLGSATLEEVLCRGYLWNRLRRLSGRPGVALLGSTVLFTAYHPYGSRSLADVFVFGLVIGFFRHTGRSLPRLILAHLGVNLAISYGWWRF